VRARPRPHQRHGLAARRVRRLHVFVHVDDQDQVRTLNIVALISLHESRRALWVWIWERYLFSVSIR
jgi:hypothetical protein